MSTKKNLIQWQVDIGDVIGASALQVASALTNTFSLSSLFKEMGITQLLVLGLLFLVAFAVEYSVKYMVIGKVSETGAGKYEYVIPGFIMIGMGLVVTGLGFLYSKFDSSMALIVALGTTLSSVGSMYQLYSLSVSEGQRQYEASLITKRKQELDMKREEERVQKEKDDRIISKKMAYLEMRERENSLQTGTDGQSTFTRVEVESTVKVYFESIRTLFNKESFSSTNLQDRLDIGRSTSFKILRVGKAAGVIVKGGNGKYKLDFSELAKI